MTRVNILAGPPICPDDDKKTVDSFLSLDGWHIVCGGSSSEMVSRCTGLEISIPLDGNFDCDTLPYGKIGNDIFATEGVMTIMNVANAFQTGIAPVSGTGEHLLYSLLISCDEINIFRGCAVNSCHPNEISFSKKEQSLIYIINKLKQLNKTVNVYSDRPLPT